MSRVCPLILTFNLLLAIFGQIVAHDAVELPTKHTTIAKEMDSELNGALSSPNLKKFEEVNAKHKYFLHSIMTLMSTNDNFAKKIKARTDINNLFSGMGLHALIADVVRFKEDFLLDKLYTKRMNREFKVFYEEIRSKYLTEVLKILTSDNFDEKHD